MTTTSITTTKHSTIPYEVWSPVLQKQGFIVDTIPRNEQFDLYATENYHSMMVEGYNSDYTGGLRSYEKELTQKIFPQGELEFKARFYRDGSLYGTGAGVRLFGENLLEFKQTEPMYWVAKQLAERLHLAFGDYYSPCSAHAVWKNEIVDIVQIEQTLGNLKTFHRKIHLLIETEAQRLLELVDLLDQK